MENDILDSLEDLGYIEPLNEESLKECMKVGASSETFTKIVEWLTKELQVLLNLEEQVNAITDPNDSASFLLELSAFLREIGCPYKCLTEGPTNQKLNSNDDKVKLLLYLCTELQATRMLELHKSTESKMKVQMKESPTALALKEMLIALNISKPPATVTPKDLFNRVDTKMQETVQHQKLQGGISGLVGKPIFFGVLSAKQWDSLDVLQQQMNKEYSIRKDLLLKRLDVTIQSFKWGDRLKKKTDEIARTYETKRRVMIAEPKIQLAHVLAAREDIAIIEKTSCGSVIKNTQCDVKKVMIGRVPDRGGRPEDQRPPPPEMPSWQKRTEPGRGGGHQGGYGGGGQRGGGEGGGGGRVQGNWTNQQQGNTNFDGGWDKGHKKQEFKPNYQQPNHQVYQQPNQYQAYQQPNHQQVYQQSYHHQDGYQQIHQQNVFQGYEQPYQQHQYQTFQQPYQSQQQPMQPQQYYQGQGQNYHPGAGGSARGRNRGGRGSGGGRGGRGSRGGGGHNMNDHQGNYY